MATFSLGKEKDDLQEPVLLPEDWYTLEITAEVAQEKNAKWKEGGIDLSADQIEGAGENIVIRGRIVSDEPEFNGRPFTKWLPLPNPSDKNQFMNNGQPKEDWKLEQIYKWVAAFAGTVEGSEVSLATGMKAQVYIVQENDRRTGDLVNSIGFVDPRAISNEVTVGADDSTF